MGQRFGFRSDEGGPKRIRGCYLLVFREDVRECGDGAVIQLGYLLEIF